MGVESAPRAHLQVVYAQSTNGASVRRAAAPEAAVHVLGLVLPARLRPSSAPGDEPRLLRPPRGPRGPPPQPPAHPPTPPAFPLPLLRPPPCPPRPAPS